MSLSQDELASIYHSARYLKENVLINNSNQHGRLDSAIGPCGRELRNMGFVECTDFDNKKKCKNPSCEGGLHSA